MTLKHAPNPAFGLLCALSAEEAAILFEPRRMFRRTVDASDWRSRVCCLIPESGALGLLLSLPCDSIRPLLASTAGHPVEAELLRLLFDAAELADWPDFTRGLALPS